MMMNHINSSLSTELSKGYKFEKKNNIEFRPIFVSTDWIKRFSHTYQKINDIMSVLINCPFPNKKQILMNIFGGFWIELYNHHKKQ